MDYNYNFFYFYHSFGMIFLNTEIIINTSIKMQVKLNLKNRSGCHNIMTRIRKRLFFNDYLYSYRLNDAGNKKRKLEINLVIIITIYNFLTL